MNANELADELETRYKYAEASECMLDAATMLRQQQAEIEVLRNQLWDLKSEPFGFDRNPAKTLTDEEITQVFDECYPNNADGDVVTLIDFARAILRKTQEK